MESKRGLIRLSASITETSPLVVSQRGERNTISAAPSRTPFQ